MIFPVSLKVLSQMLDPAGEKCDLYIRAAGIFVMQLELLEIQRLVALSHNEGPIVTWEAIFATTRRGERWWSRLGQFSRRRLPFAREKRRVRVTSAIDVRHEPLTSILSSLSKRRGGEARRTLLRS